MLFINNYLCGVFLRCRCLTQSQLSLQVKLSERAIYVALSFLLSAMLFTSIFESSVIAFQHGVIPFYNRASLKDKVQHNQ